jgi:hypothetical protein
MIRIAAVQISIIFHSCFIGITEASEEIPVLLYYPERRCIMNERQKKFAEYYVQSGNGAESARKAGYSQSYAAHRTDELLRNVEIHAENSGFFRSFLLV